MKNGSRFSKLRLIDNAAANDLEDSAEDYDMSSVSEDSDTGAESAPAPTNRALLFIVVSAACAAAAVAAGSYAIWLSRQRVARETLTNVQDILKICQDRMHQMEDDLHRLPQGFSSSPAA